jgi:uncharacterized protein (DUF4213/DUF364 family)
MSLIEALIASLPESDMTAQRIICGKDWTMVISSACGIAAVSPGTNPGRTETPDLIGRPLKNLLGLAASTDPLEASLGVAALNAALAAGFEPSRFQPAGMPRAGGKTVGVVGDFAFAEQLGSVAEKVIRISSDDAENHLSKVDIAIIAGSTMVKHRLEDLLRASASCYTIVYGPSTPLSPVLFDYGADQLVGIRVVSPEKTIKCITTGGASMMECPGVKPVVLRK